MPEKIEFIGEHPIAKPYETEEGGFFKIKIPFTEFGKAQQVNILPRGTVYKVTIEEIAENEVPF